VAWISDTWLSALLADFSYLTPFTVLLLCGVGLPLPEEVTLIASGLLVHQGQVDFFLISTVCASAILLGDSVPFWLGKRYGMNALRIGFVRRILHPERFALLEQRFEEHGNWAIFTCRFLPGVRIPGYFTAGTLGMRYTRFLLLDGLGVFISVPVSVFLGQLFAEHIEELERSVANFHQLLGFGIVSLVLIMLVRGRIRKREHEVAAVEAEVDQEEAPKAAQFDESPPNTADSAPRSEAGR
jgi:membrane protein DedA with SNARE-associated domain